MADLTKLAVYLESFGPDDPNYDQACFLKAKIAFDQEDPNTINNGGAEELGDTDVTTSSGEQRSSTDTEGDLMGDAFKELDVLNQIDEQKEEVNTAGAALEQASPDDFAHHQGVIQEKRGSAFIKDVPFKSLPQKTQHDISRFVPTSPDTQLVHYGLVVKELLPKVDHANFSVAERHIKELPAKELDKTKLFNDGKQKYILMLNDKIIDGHHFLAKCKAAGITSSLHVLDLTSARFQKVKKASLFDVLQTKLK